MEKSSVSCKSGSNKFGKQSEFHMRAVEHKGETVLRDIHFTAPYKLMAPFKNKDGSIQVMMLSASAGIMEGDEQEFVFCIESGAKVEFISQSYEKIHKMQDGCARRKTKVSVSSGAEFHFHPQPTIPFADSAYSSETGIYLADEKACFTMSEILSCGRYAGGEFFQYRFYHNRVKIYRGETLIYLDNTRYEPKKYQMEGIGMYENYTHLANIFLTANKTPADFESRVTEYLEKESDVEGGVTRLASGDYILRIFGKRAQKLEEICKNILRVS